MSERKKPSWPLWLAGIAFLLPVLYVVSFGPACWLTAGKPDPLIPRNYAPFGWAIMNAPEPVSIGLQKFALIGMWNRSRYVCVPGFKGTGGDVTIGDSP